MHGYKVDKSKVYLEFDGSVSYKNPHGYLNGDQILYMRYYFFMSLIYVAFGVFWVWKILQRKEYLIFFHYVICSVFVIAFFETWFIYIYYDLYNRFGTRSNFVYYTSWILSIIKMTSIVLTTLIVSLGYKITRKSIFKYTLRLTVLGFIYFVCSSIYVTEKLYSSENELSYAISIMARAPFYAANGVAFAWIIKSLAKTINIIKKTKQSFKLRLFNNFYYAVLITFGLLFFAGVLQILILLFRSLDTLYITLVSRELLPTVFSLVIFSIMLTMRPTTKSKLLVHHEELQEEHTEHSVDHGVGPHRPSMVEHHNPADNYFDQEEDHGSKFVRKKQPEIVKHSTESEGEASEGEYEEEEEEHEEAQDSDQVRKEERPIPVQKVEKGLPPPRAAQKQTPSQQEKYDIEKGRDEGDNDEEAHHEEDNQDESQDYKDKVEPSEHHTKAHDETSPEGVEELDAEPRELSSKEATEVLPHIPSSDVEDK